MKSHFTPIFMHSNQWDPYKSATTALIKNDQVKDSGELIQVPQGAIH